MAGPAEEPLKLAIHAKPKAKRTGIRGVRDGRVVVAVAEPADKGKANRAICRDVAAWLGIAPSAVRIAQGATSSAKLVEVSGLEPEGLRRRLAALKPA